MRLAKPVTTLAVLAALLLAPASAPAAGPKRIGTLTFVGRPELTGIAIVGFTWALRNSATAGGGGGAAGKISFDAFRVVKLLDADSPALFELTTGATSIAEVRIDVTIRRGTTASYVLSDARINGNERRTEGGATVQELSLSAVAVRETVTTAGGSVTSCFNVATIDNCN